MSNQQYQYPPVAVCFEDGSGCGFADGNINTCIASAMEFSSANLDGTYIYPVQGQADNCIEFDLTQVQIPEADRETDPGMTAYIYMDWQSTDNATAEVEYRAGVNVIIGSGEGQGSTMIPYSRNVFSSSDRNYEKTVLTIGKTSRKYLSGNLNLSYPVQTVSTTRFFTTKDFDLFSPDNSYASSLDLSENSAIATIFLEITQGSYSHTQVEDVEPLEIGTLFGNVGGFWELLVVAWGVFFITTKANDTEPTLKARDFGKPGKVLKRMARKGKRRGNLGSAAAESVGHDDSRRPSEWDSSDGDDGGHASGARGSVVIEKRLSGSNAASATINCGAYDYGIAKMKKGVITVIGSGREILSNESFRNDINGGDHGGTARTSFFPTPQASLGRIHHHDDSEDESSPSAPKPPYEPDNLVENGDDVHENDLEVGCHAVELGRGHGEV
eukprot:g2963.t1